jgi:hypothetical protein
LERPIKIPSRDIIGGVLLFASGIGIAGYAYANYRFGTLRAIGPGFLPSALGTVLGVSGAIIAVTARNRIEEIILPDLRPVGMLTASVLAFAGSLHLVGLVPAIVLLTIIAALAQRDRTPIVIGALVAAALVMSIGIFRGVLGLRLTLFAWPF